MPITMDSDPRQSFAQMMSVNGPLSNQPPSLMSMAAPGSLPDDVGNSPQPPPPAPPAKTAQPGMLSMAMRPPQMGPNGMPIAPGFVAGKKGSMAKTEGTTTNDQKTTQNTYQNADDYAQRAQILRDMPENQAEQQAINTMQAQLPGIANQRGTYNGSIDPLLALIDGYTGSKLSGTYNGGTKQADINKTLMQYQDTIAKRQADLGKSITDGVSKLKDGQTTNDQTNKLLQAFQAGSANGANKPDPAQQNFQKVATAINSQRGDKVYSQAMQDQYAGQKANVLMNQYGNLDDMSSPMVHTLVAEIGKMAQGGAPTEGTLKDLFPSTIDSKLQLMAQKVTNAPTGANLGKFLQDYKKYADDLQANANDTIADRNERVLQPYLDTGYLQPDQGAALSRANIDKFRANGLKARASAPPAQGAAPAQAGGQAPPPAAVGPHGASVKQNGVVYNWNPTTKAYE